MTDGINWRNRSARMIRTAYFLSLVLTCLPASTHAEESALSGYGAATCAEFAQNYARAPELVESQSYSWALGFMSGMNEITERQSKTFKDLNSASFEEQKAIIRAYCDQHPLKPYFFAVYEVYNKMATLPWKY